MQNTYIRHTCSREEILCSHRNSNVPYLGSDGNSCGSKLQHLRTVLVTDESVCDRGFTAVVLTWGAPAGSVVTARGTGDTDMICPTLIGWPCPRALPVWNNDILCAVPSRSFASILFGHRVRPWLLLFEIPIERRGVASSRSRWTHFRCF